MKRDTAKSAPLSQDDIALFRDAIGGTQSFKQDTVELKSKKKHTTASLQQTKKQHQAEFYFSDEYVPDIDTSGTVSYVKKGHPGFLAKQLRRGDFYPDLVLDLHGVSKDTAKEELAGLISACKKQNVYCANIVHGIGERILKHKVPHYLVQHPDVIAIHQAPLEFGGRGALLILIDLPEDAQGRR